MWNNDSIGAIYITDLIIFLLPYQKGKAGQQTKITTHTTPPCCLNKLVHPTLAKLRHSLMQSAKITQIEKEEFYFLPVLY